MIFKLDSQRCESEVGSQKVVCPFWQLDGNNGERCGFFDSKLNDTDERPIICRMVMGKGFAIIPLELMEKMK